MCYFVNKNVLLVGDRIQNENRQQVTYPIGIDWPGYMIHESGM